MMQDFTSVQDSTWIELVDQAIDLVALLPKLANPDVGAHAWFLGVTRRTTEDRITERLAYEAHRPMALAELRRLAHNAVERFSLTGLVLVHRLGVVPVGEASVVVGCSSPHRGAAFEALPWIMNELKAHVPIWKQERYVDGSTEWVHPMPKNSHTEVK